MVRTGTEEAADCAKAAFLSTMSHELRTPLNAIVGFTEVMLQGLSGPLAEEQSRQLRIVRDSAARLRGLVEDVLDISSI
ncbi:MAG: sensor histidine kinase [Steroidobacteraceae bacterium]